MKIAYKRSLDNKEFNNKSLVFKKHTRIFTKQNTEWIIVINGIEQLNLPITSEQNVSKEKREAMNGPKMIWIL